MFISIYIQFNASLNQSNVFDMLSYCLLFLVFYMKNHSITFEFLKLERQDKNQKYDARAN